MIGGALLVAAGGAIGAALRHLTVQVVAGHLSRETYWGTMLVNLGGCVLMGVGAAFLIDRLDRTYLLLLTGILGGYTTFSAYALDGYRLLEQGRLGTAALYLAGTPLLSLAAFALGMVLARTALG